jgi:hypothetical protein
MKQLLMTTIAIFGLALISNAQVPNYIPTNGLVGWWPFNGNAIDESINSNDGTVNGATLSSDRFGNSNSAYFFDGVNGSIDVLNNPSLNLENPNEFTFCYWINATSLSSSKISFILIKQTSGGINQDGFNSGVDIAFNSTCRIQNGTSTSSFTFGSPSNSITTQNWIFVCQVWNGNEGKTYLNNNLVSQTQGTAVAGNNTSDLKFGRPEFLGSNSKVFHGKIDDIGIWNRALTEQEISNLYNASICSNNLSISPATNQLEVGSTANFVATTSDTFPSYVWQSDLGQGFQTLNNYGNYSGVNTNSLSISNVQLSEHNQPIRVISTSGECIDTSNVATINITDTCIVTINDTITTLISVTDTLVISTLITGLTPPNNSNTIKVFPNPANSHITIDFGNFDSMNGYTLTITNSIGQTVYTTQINEQSSYIDLSTWSGNGIYFVQIIDTQNNIIENRKIVLQ